MDKSIDDMSAKWIQQMNPFSFNYDFSKFECIFSDHNSINLFNVVNDSADTYKISKNESQCFFLSRFKFKEMLKHMVFNEMNLLLCNFEKSLKKLKILWYHFNAVKTNAQMEIRKSLLVCRHIHFNWKSHVFLWLWNELNSVSDHLEIKSKSWKSFVWSSEFKPPKIKSETVSESLEKTWTWVTVYCQITSRLRREKDTLTSNM